MRTHLIAALGLAVVLAGPACAADVGVPYKAPPPPVDLWSGLYLGGVAGHGWSSASEETPGVFTTGDFNQKGWVAGGVVGYNWRATPMVVWGWEADVSAADIGGTAAAGLCVAPCEVKVGWLYTGRGRVGLTAGPFMPYLTAGGAVAGLKAEALFGNPTSTEPHVWGWVGGGGVELMPFPHWSLRAEFLRIGLINRTIHTPDIGVTQVTQHDINIVRGGLTYYFGTEGGAVTSRY